MEGVIMQYVEEQTANGNFQHTPGWHEAKKKTIGGSEISVLQGISPYKTEHTLIAQKSGLESSSAKMGVHPCWGNLFEDVQQHYLELKFGNDIYGNNIFIPGPPGSNTSYSPDGIGVYGDKIALYEFKCPYTRIPNGKVPPMYESQVKFGLDIIKITQVGIYSEAVFRRAKWADMGLNSKCDTMLAPKRTGTLPIAQGIIGFYSTKNAPLYNKYSKEFEIGADFNGYAMNDLGLASKDLFERILMKYDCKELSVWYGGIICPATGAYNDIEIKRQLNSSLGEYSTFLNTISIEVLNYGILPWKLYSVDIHEIQPEPGYNAKWQEKINKVIGIIEEIRGADPDDALSIFTEYTCGSSTDLIFADI